MRTNIIATLGPASHDEKILDALVDRGVRIFRLNFSHGGIESFHEIISVLRNLEKDKGIPLTLMQDLSGPKVRTCKSRHGTIEVEAGDELLLGLPAQEGEADLPFICLDHKELLDDVREGDQVALSDGMLRFRVLGRTDGGLLHLKAVNSGFAPPHKGITFPGKTTPLSAITEKDEQDLADGIKAGLDAVAISYVQSHKDILKVKELIAGHGGNQPVVAKLERQNAVSDLDRIIDATDAVMVARGDLGLECPLAALPGLQKRIIRACNMASKPVIVATQMLLSMVSRPIPTRAEVTDVANAILDGADCLMLSEETAIGDFPVETVEAMREIANEAEQYYFESNTEPLKPANDDHPGRFLAYAACLLADKANCKAIVVHTMSGSTARIVSACRPGQRIFCLSPGNPALHAMNFCWGVMPIRVEEGISDHMERAEQYVNNCETFVPGESVVITAGQPKPNEKRANTNVVKIYTK